MTVESSPPARMDLATWDAIGADFEDAYELVEGVLTMTPGESATNRVAAVELAIALRAVREAGWRIGTDIELTVREVPTATVRCPDLVVCTREAALRRPVPGKSRRVAASEVALVAEVVSPTSAERDLVTKRREYADAGVPAYLVVDLRGEPGELILYVDRGPDGRYVDVPPAESVTVTLGGLRIDLTAGRLLP